MKTEVKSVSWADYKKKKVLDLAALASASAGSGSDRMRDDAAIGEGVKLVPGPAGSATSAAMVTMRN